ncbi:MAG: 1-phosphofructokinase family hexose kinase [Ruminococcaceae bacterium]|nr:1-phosphofructokinase family hexose kinase [Oscillospiraceae bacterium]
MKKIITITLNPAFDLHYTMDKFELKKENYVKEIICDAGGKGINISRALKANGIESTAYVILGAENSAQFESSLKADGIDYLPIYVRGRIRENITIHPKKDKETRISLDNFSITRLELDKLYSILYDVVDCDTIISFSGRIPKGVTKDETIKFLCKLKGIGARLAIDSNSLTTEDLTLIQPWFIKPNEEEIVSFLGRPVTDAEEAADRAAELCEKGVAEEVMISLGSRGSAWSDGRKKAVVSIPAIESPVSTIGAGDSTVAGYIAARAKGESIDDSLRLACAFGTAACLSEGTRPPLPKDVERIFNEITVK